MRVKKIHIDRYGPLRGIDFDISHGIQVIYGKNETGKTLTIDALIKIMVGKKIKEFDGIDRVEEFPEGYLILEKDKNEEIKLNKDLSLSQFMDMDAMDLRNIFIIRNSDLSIREEENYYRRVTDKLTGLETEKINKLLSELKDYGRLTSASSDASISDSRDYGKIKGRIEDAKVLIKDIENYLNLAKESGLQDLELENLILIQKSKDLKEEISLVELNLKNKNFLDLKKLLKKLEDNLEIYKGYEKYTEEKYQKLLDLNYKLNNLLDDNLQNNRDLEKLEKKQDGFKKEASKISSNLAPYQEKERQIMSLEQKTQSIEEINPSLPKLPLTLSIIFLAFAGLSLIPLFLFNNLFYILLPVLFTMVFIIFISFYFIKYRKVLNYKKTESNLIREFLSLGIKVKNLKEAHLAIGNFYENKNKFQKNLENIESEIRANDKQIERIKSDINGNNNEISATRNDINEIKENLSINDLNALREKLDKKRELENDILGNYKLMMDKLELDLDELDIVYIKNNLNFLGDQIKKAKPEKSLRKVVNKYDKQFYEDKKRELEKIEHKKEEIKNKLENHKLEINGMRNRFFKIKTDGFLKEIKIENLNDLKKALQVLKSGVEKIEFNVSVSKKAIGIFEDILEEEELVVADLFGNLNVSDYFSEITGNKYKKVFYDNNQRRVKVVNKNGNIIDDNKLSQGAYDQLYMAVRIALAEKILDEPAFFIVDDAFIYSDVDRLKTQFEIFKKLADKGWSIIYFSVKEELKKLADKYSSNDILIFGE